MTQEDETQASVPAVGHTPEQLDQMRKAGQPKPPGVSWGDWVGPKKLSDRHKYIAYLLATGMKQGQVAREVGMTQSRLSIVQNSKRMLAEVERLRTEIYGKTVSTDFSRLALKGVKVAEEFLDNPQERSSLRYAIAKDFMDRFHGKAPERLEVKNSTLKELFEAMDRMQSFTGSHTQVNVVVPQSIDTKPTSTTITTTAIPAHQAKPDEYADIDAWIASKLPKKEGTG